MISAGKIKGPTIRVLMVVSIGVLTIIPCACTSGQDVIDIPPSELPDKGNPKLDSQLNQLIRAEKQGEAVVFAEQHGIELIDGRVRVIIECEPGQLDGASEAALDVGATLETSYSDMLQVVVPITSLTSLADASSIRFIRLPQQPLPAATDEGKEGNNDGPD